MIIDEASAKKARDAAREVENWIESVLHALEAGEVERALKELDKARACIGLAEVAIYKICDPTLAVENREAEK